MKGLLQRLDAEAADRIGRAYAPRSRPALNSALKAFARFSEACPERTLFTTPARDRDPAIAAWNEWTFILFAQYMATVPSKKTGALVCPKTVESYVSLLKGYLSYSYDFEILERSPRLKRLLDSMRECDPLRGMRRKRRGLRRRHLRRMWERFEDVRADTRRATADHALLATAWHTLARGGELVQQQRAHTAVPVSRADLSFGETSSGRRYALLWLRPLKKKGRQLQPKVPQYIQEFDGKGSDIYAALRRLEKLDPVPDNERAVTPLFRREDARGRMQPMTVPMMRALIKERMARLGYDTPSHWGAHSCRIGGATDLVSTGQTSQLLLQAKSRWGSDIERICARMTRRSQMAASSLMQRARGRDLEEILPSFVQPA